jgi:hypothetical protein
VRRAGARLRVGTLRELHENTFFGSDTFVVEKGKIQFQTIASELYISHPVKP